MSRMFRLVIAILILLMGDWIFFNAEIVLRPLAGMITYGVEFLADFIFQIAG